MSQNGNPRLYDGVEWMHLYNLGFFAFKNTRKMTNYVEKQNMYFEITNNWAKDGCDKI